MHKRLKALGFPNAENFDPNGKDFNRKIGGFGRVILMSTIFKPTRIYHFLYNTCYMYFTFKLSCQHKHFIRQHCRRKHCRR